MFFFSHLFYIFRITTECFVLLICKYILRFQNEHRTSCISFVSWLDSDEWTKPKIVVDSILTSTWMLLTFSADLVLCLYSFCFYQNDSFVYLDTKIWAMTIEIPETRILFMAQFFLSTSTNESAESVSIKLQLGNNAFFKESWKKNIKEKFKKEYRNTR